MFVFFYGGVGLLGFVPGTVWGLCTWYKSRLLYLAFIVVCVPGTPLISRVRSLGFLAQIGQIEPGSTHSICAWLKLHLLCLAQNSQIVPGTIISICAWHNNLNLCLAQTTHFVPGTNRANRAWLKNPNLCLSPTNQPTSKP
jgi:hypothetical protein